MGTLTSGRESGIMKFTFAPESRPLDGYTIKRAIYRGGFGEVYYALTDAGREVALKLLQNNSEIELRGVQQCLNLSHPNLVTIFDVKQDRDGDHWIIMEYVAGETLDVAVARHAGGMPMEEVRNWLRGIADGIGFLHERGIVHRDLKPANVFSEAGIVKIGDVGLSKFITPSRRSAQTQSVGTVYYMAPEVAKGRYGLEVDVYALGVMLYEMITGRVPFEGESTGEILMKHLSENPDLTKLPERLRPVIDIALQKDPQQRFSSVHELQQAFEAAVIGTYTPPVREAQPNIGTPQSAPIDGAQKVDVRPGRQRASELEETMHFPQGGKASLWWPTKRAFWLIMVFGLLALLWSGGEHEAGILLNLLASGMAYLGYVAGRRSVAAGEASHTVQKVVHWMDRDSRPLGADGSGWWIAAPICFLLFAVGGVAGADMGDFAEIAVPVGVVALLFHFGVGGFRSLWGSAAKVVDLDQHRDEQFAESIAAAYQNQGASPAPRPAQRAPVAAPAYRSHRRRPVGKHYYRNRPITPCSYRPVSSRTRMSQFATSATVVVPIIALLTGSVSLLAPDFFATGFVGDPGWENMGLFAATAILGSWLLMGLSKLNEGRHLDGGTRRLVQLVGGAAVGLSAFYLSEALLIGPEQPVDVYAGTLWSQPEDPMFVSLGGRILALDDGRPALLGYIAFFASLFGLRRWWWHADAFRPKRFRIGSVLLTVLLALLVSSVWAFPPIWAMTWAAVISSAVQLASVWTPPEERFVAREV